MLLFLLKNMSLIFKTNFQKKQFVRGLPRVKSKPLRYQISYQLTLNNISYRCEFGTGKLIKS